MSGTASGSATPRAGKAAQEVVHPSADGGGPLVREAHVRQLDRSPRLRADARGGRLAAPASRRTCSARPTRVRPPPPSATRTQSPPVTSRTARRWRPRRPCTARPRGDGVVSWTRSHTSGFFGVEVMVRSDRRGLPVCPSPYSSPGSPRRSPEHCGSASRSGRFGYPCMWK